MAYLLGSACVVTCPNPTYPDTNSGAGPNKCLSCNAACASCTESLAEKCQSCATGFKLSGSTCSTNCLTQYGDTTTTGLCVYCNLLCTQCFQIATNCSACTATGANAAYYITTGAYPTCIASCPVGTWLQTSNRTCIACPTGCVSCTSNTVCSQCNTTQNYLFVGTLCYSGCPTTYYQVNSTTCALCQIGCATCVNVPTNCTSCVLSGANKAFLLGNECLTSCSQPYYGATNPNVCTLCNSACQACTGPTIYECQQCMPGYKLNNATCATSCQPGFGATSNPLVCVWCNLKCASSACTNVFDNCTACTSTAPYTAFLTTIGTPYPKCLSTCLAGQYANSTDQKCHLCDSSCITCVNTSTTCYECSNSAGWLNYACFAVCADGYFLESNQVNSNKVNCPTCYNCTLCSSVCLTCTGLSTKCTACPTSGANAAYLLGNSCVGTCPNGYYKDNNGGLGPNICASCSVGCKVCINNAINCTLCITGYFFYRYTCSLTCPSGFYGNIPSSMCLSETGYAVNMTMKMYFTDSSKSTINVDITFTKAMDFTTFNMSSFQTYSIINSPNSLNTAITPAMFSYNYTATNSSSYLITITPIGYLYLNNITFVVTTIVQPTTGQFAADGTQLNPNVYQVSQSLLWYFVKSANLSGPESAFINSLSKISDHVNQFFALPYLQEIKKTGAFNLLFTGAQITSSAIVSNTIPAQNAYEGARFWSSFVYFYTPDWQENLNSSLYIFALNSEPIVNNSRLLLQSEKRMLFNTDDEYWHFQRTGFTTFFIYDCYIQILLIALSWITLLIALKWFRLSPHLGKVWSCFHKVHELSIFFITLGTILEWIYTDTSSVTRIVSLVVSIVFNIYFFAYELYIYYDLLSYPSVSLGTDEFDYYSIKYGSMLRNIRYEEHKELSPWSPRHWIRPHNYHILSYYKKYLMIIALPLFYQIEHAQMTILIVLQVLEIVRFCLTQPFKSRTRNIIRLLLEIVLLLFFISSLCQEFFINKIMLNNLLTLDTDIKNYYAFGWVAFVTVFIFNTGFIFIMLYDIVRGCGKTNYKFMVEARQYYYFEKIKAYEVDHLEVPRETVDSWVRKGALKEGLTLDDKIEPIHVTIEKIKVMRFPYGYMVSIDKALEVFRKNFSYRKVNIRKVTDSITVTKGVNPLFYEIFDNLFQNVEFKKPQEITVKTSLRLSLENYAANEAIPITLDKQEHFQFVIVERTDGKVDSFPQPKLIKGFPIDIAILKPFLSKNI